MSIAHHICLIASISGVYSDSDSFILRPVLQYRLSVSSLHKSRHNVNFCVFDDKGIGKVRSCSFSLSEKNHSGISLAEESLQAMIEEELRRF